MIKLDMPKTEEIHEIECGMYIAACLTKEQTEKMKKKWNEHGGKDVIPWYKWVLQHTHIDLDEDI